MSSRAELPAWRERPTALTQLIKAVVIALIVTVMLYPFLYVVTSSFATPAAANSGGLLPTSFSLDAYRSIFSGDVVTRALLVSVGITVVGTVLSVLFTVTTAYGLSRTKDVPGSKAALYLILLTMLFGAGIIPQYLLIRNLGLVDSYWSLILPGMVSAFNLVVVRNFFMEIPAELLESARIDGAGELRILLRIVLPLSRAVIAVIALFYAVGYWNNFFNAMLYLNDSTKWPMPQVLNEYVLQGGQLSTVTDLHQAAPPSQTVQMAVVVIATVPILAIYPFAQRYFTKGVLTGAIKG
ncbi:putative binding-protein-dependent transport systems inner membrane component [Actinacidiphila reveromycinica]|uniref:Putative binding-protein-dependent transport systems inner membrane component n=1 Tax=Actinacidiphila reveromycinica TaxID=659352 RepID=A0A7U3UPB4_9ACTN|nr:carbohydrate ABC transporter permease [Streptomyces sp. SN-593]BBA96266.1 putative binding-protein-dependent transport systems inner membrane component [Streptomyces sp. SN-593]